MDYITFHQNLFEDLNGRSTYYVRFYLTSSALQRKVSTGLIYVSSVFWNNLIIENGRLNLRAYENRSCFSLFLSYQEFPSLKLLVSFSELQMALSFQEILAIPLFCQ